MRVLYAGCGPYALLALPQMNWFSPGSVRFTLLDCNEPALQSARSLVDAFGFGEFVSEYHLGDACAYAIPRDRTFLYGLFGTGAAFGLLALLSQPGWIGGAMASAALLVGTAFPLLRLGSRQARCCRRLVSSCRRPAQPAGW